jgi:hypothetical protein
VNVVPRDPGWQVFPHTKITAENSDRHSRIVYYENLGAGAAPPWRGAAFKVFGDQLAYKSRFLLFAF